jgi:hypothetical protein
MHDRSPLEDDDTPALPCAGGLLAGTLALMTCWAQPEPDAALDAAQQRVLMARKIVSNLFLLREHPDLPPGLRLVATRLHARWGAIAEPSPVQPPQAAHPERTGSALH